MNKIYSRLAFTNIKNNKTLYMPYIISGMVMIAMFYVMMFLNNSKGLGKVPGADALASIMGLGCGTIAVFSYIFLFYTNSFIIKRRKKEVGIYNILGMEKRHIARVLIIETLTVALAARAEEQMAYRYNRTRLSCRGILYCDYHKEPSSGAFTVLCRSAACHHRNVSFIYFRKHCDT